MWITHTPPANTAWRRAFHAMIRCRRRYITATDAALRNPNASAAAIGHGSASLIGTGRPIAIQIGTITNNAATPEKHPGAIASTSHPNRVRGDPIFSTSGSPHSGHFADWLSRRSYPQRGQGIDRPFRNAMTSTSVPWSGRAVSGVSSPFICLGSACPLRCSQRRSSLRSGSIIGLNSMPA
jgi:hypothetical protein